MQVAKQMVTALKVFALMEGVSIPFVQQLLDQDRRIQPNEMMAGAATAMLDELARVEAAMRQLRADR